LKIVIAAVALLALGAIAGVLYVGHRSAEPTVVADPYEAGLRYGEAHHEHDAAAVGPRAAPACDAGTSPCAQPLPGGGVATLEIAPRPVRAMRDLDFTVRVTPPGAIGAKGLSIRLTMPGMYMGENVVRLSPGGDGVFRGKGVVVRCGSGRRDWSAELVQTSGAPGSGEAAAAPAGRFGLTISD